MSHLNLKINEFGVNCVINHWKDSGSYVADKLNRLHLLPMEIDGKRVQAKVLVKASEIEKVKSYLQGINEDRLNTILEHQKSLFEPIWMIFVDSRTSEIYGQSLEILMQHTHDGFLGIDLPWIIATKRTGKAYYWSAYQMQSFSKLTEDEIWGLIQLRTQNSTPKNQIAIGFEKPEKPEKDITFELDNL